MVLEFVGVDDIFGFTLDLTLSTGRYINSMPMVFAFRIVDCFFCMGPKVLFQVG